MLRIIFLTILLTGCAAKEPAACYSKEEIIQAFAERDAAMQIIANKVIVHDDYVKTLADNLGKLIKKGSSYGTWSGCFSKF